MQINIVSPSLVREEVERQITFPVELCLSGLSGLKQVRALSQFGLSQVAVMFDDGSLLCGERQPRGSFSVRDSVTSVLPEPRSCPCESRAAPAGETLRSSRG